MNLAKAYNSSELESLLDAQCSMHTTQKFDTISTLSNPVDGSLGFISKESSHDISKFSALIVDELFTAKINNTILFKTSNVMRAVARLLAEASKDYKYSLSNDHPHVTIGENVKIGKIV